MSYEFPVFRTEAVEKFYGKGDDALQLVRDFVAEWESRIDQGEEVTLIELRAGYLPEEGDDSPISLRATVLYT